MSPDLDSLVRRIQTAAKEAYPGCTMDGFVRLQGGASSITLAATLHAESGSRKVVLKVAPPGLAPVRNRDVLRQARIMRSLASSRVPVPAVLFGDPGYPPDDPPFFAMQHVDGLCSDPIFDAHPTADLRDVHTRALSCAATLGTLHAIPIAELGMTDEPVTSIADEIARWQRLMVSTAVFPNEAEPIATRLAERMPLPLPPVLVHGDYRVGSVITSGPDVVAVIDWETWSVGDPRIDLSRFVISSGPNHPLARRNVAEMPSEAKLATAYIGTGNADVTIDFAWFKALNEYKSAAMCASNMKNNARAASPNPMVSAWPDDLPRQFLQNADEYLDSLG
jgi:aminoglycoside phosphotransferase (APT) family kinase protein